MHLSYLFTTITNTTVSTKDFSLSFKIPNVLFLNSEVIICLLILKTQSLRLLTPN